MSDRVKRVYFFLTDYSTIHTYASVIQFFCQRQENTTIWHNSRVVLKKKYIIVFIVIRKMFGHVTIEANNFSACKNRKKV